MGHQRVSRKLAKTGSPLIIQLSRFNDCRKKEDIREFTQPN
jgi:hypothetical protein